jgi:acetyl esterase/lipase
MNVLERNPPSSDLTIRYGGGPLHFAELRFPKTAKPWPMVFNIHGGFWRARHSLAHAGHLCAGFTKAGFATCNVEYRRVGDEGGGWPGSLDDIRAAYEWLQGQSAELGFDGGRTVVVGHSAGGQLALCLAAYEPSVTSVVSLAGVLDLKRAYDLHLSDDAAVEFLGGTPQQVPERYWKASPMNLKVTARQAIVTGNADQTVPPDFSSKYVEVKHAIGEDVELVVIPQADHLDVIDPDSDAFQMVVRTVQKMLP